MQKFEIIDTHFLGNHKHHEYTFEGISILQHPQITEYFPKIINDYDRIIELGTYFGGLTLYLYRIKKPETELISYDIDTTLCKIPKEYNIDCRWGDWWHEKWLKEFEELMKEPLKRILLLCDGGYKEYEFNTFSNFLKPKDTIMVHDYAENLEEYRQITEEIEWYDIPDASYEMILDSIKRNKLYPHPLYNEFKKVLWGIFNK